jgi:ribosomal protein L37AE/L43A
MTQKRLCPIDGCDMLIQTKDYCGKHLKEVKEASPKIRKGDPCEHCGSGRIIRAGIRNREQVWRCSSCRKYK